MHPKKVKIYHAFVLKHDSNREKQVLLLMIWNGGKREANSKGRNAKSFNDKDDNIILHSKNYQHY